jgi:tRNA-modifying protein YgfZ
MTTTSVPADYQATLESATLFEEQHAGRILMRGRDRAALLQRLSTNDIERLRPGQGAQTVLTTPIGRIIDVLTVYVFEQHLLVVTSVGQGPAVFGYLKKNIFFNDQVTLEPAGRSLAQFVLYGPHSTAMLAAASNATITALALHGITTIQIAGADISIARCQDFGAGAHRLFVPGEAQADVRAALQQAGSTELSADSYECLRIEAGLPIVGKELSQEYIPLETGLLEAVSFSKGCYVGQEIIARMESRGRLAKQLRGLRLSEPITDAAPLKLQIDGKDAGDLTSITDSPRYGPIALAYVRTAHADPGTQVAIAQHNVVGAVINLPFGGGSDG